MSATNFNTRFSLVAAMIVLCAAALNVTAQELPEIPQDTELRQLVRTTMSDFSDALNAKRFDKFRASAQVSNAFLKSTTANQMAAEFKPFIDNKIDLSAVKEANIVFDQVPSLADDVMRVAGHFETQPMTVQFDLAYVREGGKWNMHGISVGLKKTDAKAAAGPVLPSSVKPTGPTAAGKQLLSIDNKLRKLITDTLIDFNTAVKRKDFTDFLNKASPQMKKQVTPAKLKDAYALFINENVDISEVAKSEPHFDETPSVANGSILTLKGHFRVTPQFVVFDADYFKVGNDWKLLSLSVQTVTPGEFKESRTGKGPSDAGETPKTAKPPEGDKPDDAPAGDVKPETEKSDGDKNPEEMKKEEKKE